ncbi:MAG: 23S rRNA (pseudouridine(1915)-N(3))-methyltransferase RlmH [Cryomorphaceae bacterium]|nr:23S rRNA (pseudouridine(1915)-N(3))-methyltransferase RlmH [Cryomorphaceae bacterium]
MEIVFLRVGKTDMSFVAEGEALYHNRLTHYFSKIIMRDIPPGDAGKKTKPDFVSQKEGEKFLSVISPTDFLVLLDEKGKHYNSIEFSTVLQKWMNTGPKRMVFVVGGAFGFSQEVYLRANAKLSLSKMTFSHQIIRVIFLEQLYRAATIIKGEKYHNP